MITQPSILALDTSTDVCTVGLLHEGHIAEDTRHAPRLHASLVLPMVDTLLDAAGIDTADLDAIAFGCGPGSFTGLRIASGVTQGLAFAHKTPVIPISSLYAMAYRAHQQSGCDDVLVASDAHMGEVYWGDYHFESGFCTAPTESLLAPEAISWDESKQYTAIGNAWDVYPELKQKSADAGLSVTADVHPFAEDILILAQKAFAAGDVVSAEEALPVYLRSKDAWKK